MDAIETVGLVRRFGAQVAVDHVDLVVCEGEIYGFLGPNGAGKSTMIRMLTTLLRPTSGTAIVAGYDISSDPDEVRVRIGVALQDASLDERQTGIEILRLQAQLYGLNRREVDERVEAVASLIDIGAALGRRVATYSGGMKRRLDLAAALVHNPRVLFLDEPTTGLDPASRLRVWDEIRRLNSELGMTIFLTTQYLEEADALTDRIGVINSGKIVAEGSPDELKRSIGADVIVARIDGDVEIAAKVVRSISGIDSVEIYGADVAIHTEDGPRLVSAVAVALYRSSVAVSELTLRRPTLDDVFLELTGEHIQASEIE